MHSDALAALVDDLGIPTVAARASAIRQHVLEMPAPVVADALGYHQVTTAQTRGPSWGTWSRYASGDPPAVTIGLSSTENSRQLNMRTYQYQAPAPQHRPPGRYRTISRSPITRLRPLRTR
jgi:hypothetical protein